MADPSGHGVWEGLWPLACWDLGFESRRGGVGGGMNIFFL
jgi:hypothetical protein